MSEPNRRFSYALVTAQLVCLVLIAATGPLFASRPVLLLLEALAGSLGLWAILTIGPANFNVTPDVKKQARLATAGPYRYIRHPMYSALLLGALALVIDRFSYLRLALWLVLLVDLLIKLAYEERLLSRDLDGYTAYRQHTKRLIPYLY